MKSRLALVLVLTLSHIGCGQDAEVPEATSEAGWAKLPPEKDLVHFQEDNFGVRFSHSKALSTLYNPQDDAKSVGILSKGKLTGILSIRPAPTENVETFIEAGKNHLRKTYGASTVDYRLLKNQQGYSFHYLKAHFTKEGAGCVVEWFVHLRDRKKTPSDSPSDSGAYAFRFKYKKKHYEKVKLETRTVVDTFRIDDTAARTRTPQ